MGHDVGDAAESALDDLVSRVVHARAEIARMQADEAALLAEAADLVLRREHDRRAAGNRTPHDLPLREVTSELGAAMRLSDRAVQERMSTASTLVDAFQATFSSLREGRIDLAHASAIIDPGVVVADPVLRAEYERIVLEAAQFETPYRLRAIARVVAARIDPTMVAELQRRARGSRKVRVIDIGDGMARLLADLPAVLAHAIHDRLTQMAHEVSEATAEAATAEDPVATEDPVTDEAALDDDGSGLVMIVTGSARTASGSKSPEAEAETQACTDSGSADADVADERTMDELRADILADLILTGTPSAHGKGDALSAIRAHVQITIPVLTAAGQSDEPALLAGYGPIDRETAQCLAAGASGWDRVMFHPHTGAILAVDRYRPGAELDRFLRVRDERCRFPGCTQRPWRCDLDHTVDFALGGETRECNLAHLCRRHHVVKHATGWRVRQLGHGTLEWISLTGRRYVDRPPALVQFVPSPQWQVAGSLPDSERPPF